MVKKKSINGSYTTTCTSFLYKIVNTIIREEASKYFVSVLVKDIITLLITKTNVGIDLGVKYVLLKIKDMIESTTNKLSKYLTLPSLSEIVKN